MGTRGESSQGNVPERVGSTGHRDQAEQHHHRRLQAGQLAQVTKLNFGVF